MSRLVQSFGHSGVASLTVVLHRISATARDMRSDEVPAADIKPGAVAIRGGDMATKFTTRFPSGRSPDEQEIKT